MNYADKHSTRLMGGGMHIGRICSACGKKASQTGGGIRLVMGTRQFVCIACKTRIDERKKK